MGTKTFQMGSIEFFTEAGAAMTPPERIGGALGFEEDSDSDWGKEREDEEEKLIDVAGDGISITVSSNCKGVNGYAHHGPSNSNFDWRHRASWLFDWYTGGNYNQVIGDSNVSHIKQNKFVIKLQEFDSSADTFADADVDGSGNGVILYFTFNGCEEPPVYYRWWTASDNSLNGRIMTSWTTVCDWNNNERTYTLSREADPDINDMFRANYNVYPDSPVTRADGTLERVLDSGTDISNAIIITDSSGNDYSFYSLAPPLTEPEPEPEPEALYPEPEPEPEQEVTGYAMSDTNIKTAVVAWIENSTLAQAQYGHISTWDTSAVTNFDELFIGNPTTDFNENISLWNVSSATSMVSMFENCKFNNDISNWDVSSVTDMTQMFYSYALSEYANGVTVTGFFNQNISTWNVSSVTTMKNMFHDNALFNQEIGDWDVSKVEDMYQAFRQANAFNGNIGGWDVSSVTNMEKMFYSADSFNADINSWNVSSVANMKYMFGFVDSFNTNLDTWDVSNVTNMQNMFHDADVFNQDISTWNVPDLPGIASGMYGDAPIADEYKAPNT